MAGISTVVVDDREPAEFPILFAEAGADQVEVGRLSVGDFFVNGRWVFERKTMADFCVSLIDGRLFRQSINMLKVSSLPVMVLQGSSSEIGQYA